MKSKLSQTSQNFDLRRLFLDIDGVLIGKNPAGECRLADGAEEFLEFCLERFEVFWLTTHCKGDAETAVAYLAQYADGRFLELARRVKPSNFDVFKTEALSGEFLWIDDQPLAGEIQWLSDHNALHRWLQVNTYRDFHGLGRLKEFLRRLNP